jgi:hypothetical protein
MSKITPQENHTDKETSIREEENVEDEKIVELNDDEEKIYKKVLKKIEEKYDLVEKKVGFEKYYEENMKDYRLGAYDILFGPKENYTIDKDLFKKASKKEKEIMQLEGLLLYWAIYVKISELSVMMYFILSIDWSVMGFTDDCEDCHYHNVTLLNMTFRTSEYEPEEAPSDALNMILTIWIFLLWIFYVGLTLCSSLIKTTNQLKKVSCWWASLEMMEITIMIFVTIFLSGSYMNSGYDMELILNGVAILFIADIDESLMSFYVPPQSKLHKKICHSYYQQNKS